MAHEVKNCSQFLRWNWSKCTQLKVDYIFFIFCMLPYQNLNQYISDCYASTFYYDPIYIIPNQDNCWSVVNYADAPAPSLAINSIDSPSKPEEPTNPNTKTKRNKEKIEHESEASCHIGEEESDQSPDFKSRQKYGRNINSNIFHQMLKAIRQEDQLNDILDRLLSSGRIQLTKKQFYDLLQKRVSKLNPYVSTSKMSSFLNGVSKVKPVHWRDSTRTDGEFLKALRILCRYYLSNVHLLFVFNKLKLQKLSKVHHIQGMRKILECMIK